MDMISPAETINRTAQTLTSKMRCAVQFRLSQTLDLWLLPLLLRLYYCLSIGTFVQSPLNYESQNNNIIIVMFHLCKTSTQPFPSSKLSSIKLNYYCFHFTPLTSLLYCGSVDVKSIKNFFKTTLWMGSSL